MRYDWFKQFLINQFESLLRFSQISIGIKIRIQFLVIVYYEVMFYMLMMLMNFSFVPRNFFRFFFFQDQDQDQDSTSKFNNKGYALCFKDTHQIWCRSAKFFKFKILFKMRIRIRIMILLWISIPDLHFIHRRHPPNFVWIR